LPLMRPGLIAGWILLATIFMREFSLSPFLPLNSLRSPLRGWFNALPKDTQKMLLDLRREYGVRYAQTLMDDESAIRKEWQEKHGVRFYDPSPADAKFIRQAGNAANEQMFKKQEADGHKNVRQVWAYYLKARQKYEAERKKKVSG